MREPLTITVKESRVATREYYEETYTAESLRAVFGDDPKSCVVIALLVQLEAEREAREAAEAQVTRLEQELQHVKLGSGYQSCIAIVDAALFAQETRKREAAEASAAQAEQTVARLEAEHFHPSHYIREEMDEREWGPKDVTARFTSTGDEWSVDALAFQMLMAVGGTNTNCRMGADLAQRLSEAFGVSAEFFLNLETAWLEKAQKAEALAPTPPEGT